MAKINLLPWREALKEEREKQFKIMAGVAAAIGLGLVAAWHIEIEAAKSAQQERNTLITKNITEVNLLLTKKKKLEAEEKILRDRMDVIQKLQLSRPLAVQLFDGFARTLPKEITLLSVIQKQTTIAIKGKATSNTAVSAYMRRLDQSTIFGRPQLKQISVKKQGDGKRISDFDITIKQQLQGPSMVKKP